MRPAHQPLTLLAINLGEHENQDQEFQDQGAGGGQEGAVGGGQEGAGGGGQEGAGRVQEAEEAGE